MNGLSPSGACAPFTYRNTRGEELGGVRSLMLAHVVNHGTHHRGQISVGEDATSSALAVQPAATAAAVECAALHRAAPPARRHAHSVSLIVGCC